MKQGYLERLDEMLAAGAAQLGREFARTQAEYVRSKQQLDGGFAGRRGGSDVYYTDFALRTLALLDRKSEALVRATGYVAGLGGEPLDVPECFNRLNCARTIRSCGISASIDVDSIKARLAQGAKGAYETFLAALCAAMLGLAMPPLGDVSGELCRQTSTTAAAVGCLMMSGSFDGAASRAAAEFIASMQTRDGGFLAHGAAPEPDLLSTFTALVTLSTLNALDGADLAAAGRFLRSLAAPGGGFSACASDGEPDVEYTYYGVATAALLRSHIAAHDGSAPSS